MNDTGAAAAFLASRACILKHRTDYDAAVREFRWPRQERFNWALDYFDAVATGNDRPALHIVEEDGTETIRSFAELSAASNRVANFLRNLGARRGDCLMLMLGNEVALWETLLAAIKLGVIVTPATTLLTTADLQDRVDRGRVRHVVTSAAHMSKLDGVTGYFTRIAVGDAASGWHRYESARHADSVFTPSEATAANDPMLLYFTSGTTANPKLVVHTHQSYPIGHLSTMYWIGLQPGDRHWNISSPGWAKHAWSCVLRAVERRGDRLHFQLRALRREGRARCARPASGDDLVRATDGLANADPGAVGDYRVVLREALSAGEPLNPEVIERVEHAWGLTIRDGYGQTETTAQIGNSPGQP